MSGFEKNSYNIIRSVKLAIPGALITVKRPRPAIRGWNKTLCELSADGEIKVVSASGAFITITSLWNKRDQWCGMHAPWRHARINYMLRRLTALTFEVNGTLRRQSARQYACLTRDAVVVATCVLRTDPLDDFWNPHATINWREEEKEWTLFDKMLTLISIK